VLRELLADQSRKLLFGGTAVATDRRAGPRQGPYVGKGKLPRARTKSGMWRAKRSDAGKARGPRKAKGLFGFFK
jgi:hypothetical protein